MNKFDQFILDFCNSKEKEIKYENVYFPYILFVYGSYTMEFPELQFSKLPYHLEWMVSRVTANNEKEFIFFLSNFYIIGYYRLYTTNNEKGCPFQIEDNIIKKGETGTIQKGF